MVPESQVPRRRPCEVSRKEELVFFSFHCRLVETGENPSEVLAAEVVVAVTVGGMLTGVLVEVSVAREALGVMVAGELVAVGRMLAWVAIVVTGESSSCCWVIRRWQAHYSGWTAGRSCLVVPTTKWAGW